MGWCRYILSNGDLCCREAEKQVAGKFACELHCRPVVAAAPAPAEPLERVQAKITAMAGRQAKAKPAPVYVDQRKREQLRYWQGQLRTAKRRCDELVNELTARGKTDEG